MAHDNDYEVNNAPENEEREIDLMEIGVKLWKARRRLLVWGCWGALLGLIIAFSIPREYTTTVTLVPESTEGKTGGLSSLAAMAGINLGGAEGEDAVYPDLYPDVVQSLPFTVELFNVKLPMEKEPGDTLTLEYILNKKTSAPWWGYIMALPGKAIGGVKGLFSSAKAEEPGAPVNPFRLTQKQSSTAKAINGRVGADVDTKTGVVTISVTLQDPLAAASLADTVTRRLQDYITDYRTGKARQDLEYARKINDEAKESYNKAKQAYARAVDRNHGLVSKSAAIELESLQNESTLAFNLYNTTAQQVQLAEAKVQSHTPVFAIVNPASVPVKASKPRKVIILLGFIFLAVATAAAYTLFYPGLAASFRAKSAQSEEENAPEE